MKNIKSPSALHLKIATKQLLINGHYKLISEPQKIFNSFSTVYVGDNFLNTFETKLGSQFSN